MCLYLPVVFLTRHSHQRPVQILLYLITMNVFGDETLELIHIVQHQRVSLRINWFRRYSVKV